MRNRVLIPERMDDPNLDSGEHRRALLGLRRINTWTGNAALMWRHVSATTRAGLVGPLRVLDIATGAADIPLALLRLAASQGIMLEIDACDFSEQALAVARQNCASAGARIRLFRHDILHDEIDQRYDVVMCSQFLHHLTEPEVERVLRKMKSAASKRVVAVDLERGRVNWMQVWLATRILSRSQVVHFDGPQSVRAAFTVSEILQLAERAGFAEVEIHRSWPCRLVLVGEPHGSA